MKTAWTRTAVGIMALAIPIGASAAELHGLSTIAMQSAMEELIPHFEKASGHKVHVAFGLGVAMAKRVQDGESADFVVGPRVAIDGLTKAGKLAPGSEATLARSSVGVAVRKGAPKPDISTPEALKRTLLAAKSIIYTDPALRSPSGVHFANVLERLGIAEQMKVKSKLHDGVGFNAEFVARGEIELA